MRIGINSKKDNKEQDTLGPEAGEVAGPGGANMTGGDVTPHQDAGVASDDVNQTRGDSQRMEERQHAGEVGSQNEDLHPAAQDSSGGNDSDGAGTGTNPGSRGGARDGSGEGSANKTEDGSKKKSDVKSAASQAASSAAEQVSELDEVKTQLLQLAADFENYKRNSLRREEEARERVTRGVLEDLLPVLDNFERAAQAAETTTDVQSLKIGVEYILQQFQEAIKNSGAEPIEAVGKPFDPALHDAIEEIESDSAHGTVVQDVQRGYLFKGKVLRPSRVRVAK